MALPSRASVPVGPTQAHLDIPDIPEPADHELETQVSWGL